jgi:hypothetical protein
MDIGLDMQGHYRAFLYKLRTKDTALDDTILEYEVLDAVHEADGCVTQRDISESISRSLSSVNFALRLLAVKGYIKILGANRNRLRYHITPSGVVRKSIIAYNFVKRQRSLFDQVRRDFLGKLSGLRTEGVKTASFYGWTPFTECAILQIVFEGIQPKTIYLETPETETQWNKIPFEVIEAYRPDADVLVLMEALPASWDEKIETRKVACYPVV